MIRSLGAWFTRLAHRFMPHPFVFALLLTLVTFGLGLTGRTGLTALVDAWYQGFFNRGLLVFALQMALILVTGHALAESPPVRRLLDHLAGFVRGTPSATVITAVVAMITGLLNWGLGLICGALMARAVAHSARRRGVPVHYPLVVAAGYTGLLIWHGGLSGSAPVSIATPGHPLEAAMGVIPVRDTLLSPLNLVVSVLLLVLVPLFLRWMAPGATAVEEAPPPPPKAPPEAGPLTPARRLETSRVLAGVVVLLGLVFLVPYFWSHGWSGVNLNSMIFTFIIVGLLFHGTPRGYAGSIDGAASGAGGILLQFPFYFGIMGLMTGAGLVSKLAGVFVNWTEGLAAMGAPAGPVYLLLTFISGGLVNLFVPSGGGQWAVQGPIAVEAAARLGVDLPHVVMALSYGDELTNMLQPFWALPLLGITGLHARQIIGYTALLMLLVAPIFAAALIIAG